MVNRFTDENAARTLKVVGIVLILSFLLDFLILLFPFKPTDRGWQISLATALVDRGIVPMVGLGILFAGHWIGTTTDSERSQTLDLRFPALILSSILGLIFLLIFPLHLNNVNQAKNQRVEKIAQDAQQAENQLKTQLSQVQAQLNSEQAKARIEEQKKQLKAQFTELVKDEQRYKQALENPQLPEAQKELLRKFKKNPQELDKFIAQQSDPQIIANQRLAQIRVRKEELQETTQQEALKSGLRIGISSLLLSIGYIIIGWTGLKGMGAVKGGGRKAPVR
ncbi:MAG: HpsJ family protein [Nostocaceae cyanobacterium]|nr:HpsJ family protein [Nostocaceae cyanobacterium]